MSNGEVVCIMRYRTLLLILCIVVFTGVANAAVIQRPMVGFLPFEGVRGSYRHAIPELIFWQLSYVPGIERTAMGPMVSCIELDRLSTPRALSDTAAYSRLAKATGVDYLVIGEIERQNRAYAWFRLIVFSASDVNFRREYRHECSLDYMVGEAISVAKEIAQTVGVPVATSIKFDTHRIDSQTLQTLGVLNKAIRLYTGCESDRSDWDKSSRLANQALSQCPSSPMISEWTLSYSFSGRENLEAYIDLSRRCPGNLSVLADVKYLYFFRYKPDKARLYARDWLRLDPTSPLAQIAVNGKATSPITGAWRNELSVAYLYAMMADSNNLHTHLSSLKARQPRSAYLQYCSGRYLLWAGDRNAALAAYENAAKINPDSYRLQMYLIRSYLRANRIDEAEPRLKLALKRWPNRSECHFLASSLYRHNRQYDKAADEMKIVERLNPDGEINHEMLATDYLGSGNLVEGVHELAQGNPGFRKGMIIVSLVLTGIFLLAILGVVLLVRAVLSRS